MARGIGGSSAIGDDERDEKEGNGDEGDEERDFGASLPARRTWSTTLSICPVSTDSSLKALAWIASFVMAEAAATLAHST